MERHHLDEAEALPIVTAQDMAWDHLLSGDRDLRTAALADAWSLRNVMRFGWPNWETSAHLANAYAYGVAHPDVLGWTLAVKVPSFILILLFCGGLFLPELRRSLRGTREEQTSALWLTVGLEFFMA